MEKQLLILGLLRVQEMHGYQLNELLAQNPGIPITLKKANAYQLLGKMEADGWITHREEYEGNRPLRRIYTLQPEGERAFQRLLRESLAEHPLPELPAAVAYSFLSELPSDEALTLLQQRRAQVEARWRELYAVPEEVQQQHLGMLYMLRFYQSELTWLDEVRARLSR